MDVTLESLFQYGDKIVATVDKYNRISLSIEDEDGIHEVYGDISGELETYVNDVYKQLNDCYKNLEKFEPDISIPYKTIYKGKSKTPFSVICYWFATNNAPVELYCAIESNWQSLDFFIRIGSYSADTDEVDMLDTMKRDLLKDIQLAKKEITGLL